MERITKRVGSLIRLKPEYEERYIILHKYTFPGVLDRIRKSNIRNYSIFLLDGILFSYYEYTGKDYKADMKKIGDPITRDWWKLTDPMQEPLSSRKRGEWWAEMELLLHFNETKKSYSKVIRLAYTAEIKSDFRKKVKNIFSDFNQSLKLLFAETHIQNHSVYLNENKIYVYFEYTDRDFTKDDKKLNSDPKVKKFNNELEKSLKTKWKEMNEVFHTA